MKKTMNYFWARQNTLERRLFWCILMVVALVSSFSAIFTIFEGLSPIASFFSCGCVLMCFVVGLVAIKTSLYDQCYLVMCNMLSCFLLPILFFSCGGITSGMPLYCITSLALIAFSTCGTAKVVAFVVSLVVQVITVCSAWLHPEWGLQELNRDASFLDFLVTLVLTGFTLFVVGSFALYAYEEERCKVAKLKARLDYLAMRDPLTELYNRNYFWNYLKNTVWFRRDNFFMAMVEIDDFEKICSEYGPEFGDDVVFAVGRQLQRFEEKSSGGCAARYGFAKFALAIYGTSEGEALAQVENFRKAVGQISFEKNPQVKLTVSAGFLPCGNRHVADVRRLLPKVDELLLLATNEGKNRIRNMAGN